MNVAVARSRTPSPGWALIAATVAVSFSAILIRAAGDDPATIVWLRMGMAAVLLAPWVVRDGRRGVLPKGLAQLGLVLASGVFLAGHFLLWTASLKYTSIAASVLLVSLHPIIVTPLGKRLLGERVSRRVLAGGGLAIIGMLVTCTGDLRVGTSAFGGDLLALAGGVCLAGYLLIGRSVRANLGVAGYSAIVYAVVCVIAALTAAVGGVAHLPSPRVSLACLGLAVVCTIGGHTVYNWALRHVPVLLVSVSFLGEPPLAAALALLILASVPSLATVAGGVLILAGLGLALIEPGSRPGRPGDLAIAQ
ncbi:MAG TPA: DMT family transporter [Candidatus Saccharimonadales bacterium]|nr:DMT family transporter [Candidatus Saccharimonadales bacterium]